MKNIGWTIYPFPVVVRTCKTEVGAMLWVGKNGFQKSCSLIRLTNERALFPYLRPWPQCKCGWNQTYWSESNIGSAIDTTSVEKNHLRQNSCFGRFLESVLRFGHLEVPFFGTWKLALLPKVPVKKWNFKCPNLRTYVIATSYKWPTGYILHLTPQPDKLNNSLDNLCGGGHAPSHHNCYIWFLVACDMWLAFS